MRSWSALVAGVVFVALITTAVGAGRPPVLPTHSEALNVTRRHLPPGFHAYETQRYLVFSDADPSLARRQGQRLERTYHQFHRAMRRLDINPQPLRHKLVCVLFQNRSSYRRFAAQFDEVDADWIAGHYSPRHDRVVLYVAATNPSVLDANARLNDMQGDIASITAESHEAHQCGHLERAQSLARHAAEYRDHLEQERQRVRQFADRIDVATSAHEAIHQLLFHTGVQNTRISYPVWISEGLATTFETEAPAAAFGPEYEYQPRRKAFEDLIEYGRVLPLADLVTWTQMPADNQLVHAAYHQSYALVTWLYRYERDGLKRYLRDLAREPAGLISPDRALHLFERSFGKTDALQRRWLRAENERIIARRRDR